MKLLSFDSAVQTCKEHLTNTNTYGTEIEAFLTRYLLVMMCAAFEEEIEKIVVNRASQAKDVHLLNFVETCLRSVFRSTKTSEIAGLLARFSPECKERFRDNCDERAATFFNNIVVNRHTTAHESGSNVTFNDLVMFYDEGHTVLDAVEMALSVT